MSTDALKPLTKRQQIVFDTIAQYISIYGYSPTLRELCESLGIKSTNGISDHLKALRRKGYLHRKRGQARGLVLLTGTTQFDGMLMVRGPKAEQRKPLTKRQGLAFEFIVAEILEKSMPPSIREIGDHMGCISTNGVADHLKALQRKGYILRTQGTCRGIVAIVDAEE